MRLYQYCRSNIVENWGKIGPMRKEEQGKEIKWYHGSGGTRETDLEERTDYTTNVFYLFRFELNLFFILFSWYFPGYILPHIKF